MARLIRLENVQLSREPINGHLAEERAVYVLASRVNLSQREIMFSNLVLKQLNQVKRLVQCEFYNGNMDFSMQYTFLDFESFTSGSETKFIDGNLFATSFERLTSECNTNYFTRHNPELVLGKGMSFSGWLPGYGKC